MSDPNTGINFASSPDPAEERCAQLAVLIPEAFSEGKLDLASLRRALGENIVIEGGERYALNWAGKSDAYKVLQTPSTATLRPERDKSVNFDQAQHVFIEGENLEVLKVLQKAYFGKVKLIYIDPPYNTGSDSFIYPDRFQESKEDYLKRINDLSDDGTLMREGFFRKNSKESGHYHSNWLSMMLPRLYIARNLLREDVRFNRGMVQNERDKVTVHLRKGFETDPQFLELWERIRTRTRYSVAYQTGELVTNAASRINSKMPAIERPKVALTRAEIAIGAGGVVGKQTGYRTQTVEAKYVMPDFVGQVQAKTGLAKSTVARILLESGRLNDAVNNPQAFIDHVSELINAVKRDFLVYGDGSDGSGVKYVKLDNAVYEMRRFERDDLMEVFSSNVQAVGKSEKTLFSHIVIDSNSGPERAFAQACEDNADVLFYIKLPRWFQIETPVGPYNPDWAVTYQNDNTLYFVAETKKTGGGDHVQLGLLRPIEDLRIECGKRHFKNFEQVQFRVVDSLEKLLS